MILTQIDSFAYQVDLSSTRRIHLILSLAQLELVPDPSKDPLHQDRPHHPRSVEAASGEDQHCEVSRIIRKCTSPKGRRTTTEYLGTWAGYGPEDDSWLNVNRLQNARDVTDDYKQSRLQQRVA